MKKVRQGVVISNKMSQTVVVEVERVFRHPFYQKVIKRATRFKAHDAKGECQVGELVEICETRPLSKDKRWRVVRRIKSDPKS